jgi:hypothetical protein
MVFAAGGEAGHAGPRVIDRFRLRGFANRRAIAPARVRPAPLARRGEACRPEIGLVVPGMAGPAWAGSKMNSQALYLAARVNFS